MRIPFHSSSPAFNAWVNIQYETQSNGILRFHFRSQVDNCSGCAEMGEIEVAYGMTGCRDSNRGITSIQFF